MSDDSEVNRETDSPFRRLFRLCIPEIEMCPAS
jgi:hypothetical protein